MSYSKQTLLRTLFATLIIVFLFPASSVADTGNPFLHMIGQPYASYMMEMKDIRYNMDYKWDQKKTDSIMTYMEETVAATGNQRWKFEQRFLMLSYRFHYEQGFTPREVIQYLKDLVQDATNAHDTIVTIRTQHELMHAYWNFTKDYENAFEMSKLLTKELVHVQVDELPEKLHTSLSIGDMYYRFRDYDEARMFYNQILETPKAAAKYNLLQSTYNGLALIARYYDNDLDASDRYLHLILSIPQHTLTSILHMESWKGIAHGNLGYNQFLRKRYKEAIPELEFAREQMAGLNDYTYAGFMAITLADIYQRLGDQATCKQYLDLVEEYNGKTETYKSPNSLYPILCKYYFATGNTRLGEQYMDSVIATQKRAGEEFNQLKLVRAEQRSHKLEQQAKEEELKAQQQEVAKYRQIIVFVAATALLIGIAAALLTLLHIRKRNAYRMLAQKNRELAASGLSRRPAIEPRTELLPEKETSSEEEENRTVTEPTPQDIELMEQIRQLMEVQQVYQQTDLDLAGLTELLNNKRMAVSNAINHCTGRSITQYINDQRIDEAIRLLSDPEKAQLTVDALAFQIGFNDRKSFYRTFKKTTGLSPSEFRKSILEQN